MDEDELPNEDDETPTWMNISEGQTVREGQKHRSRLACNFSRLPQLSREPSTSSTDGELPASLAPWSASPPSRQPAPCTPHPPFRQPPPCTPCRPSRPRPILGRGQGDTNIKTGHGEPNIETDHQRSDQIVQTLHEGLTNLGVNHQYLFASYSVSETAPGLSNTLPIDHDDSNCSYLGGFDPSDKGFVSGVVKPDGSEGPLHPDQDHQQPFMPFQKEHLFKTCNNNNSRPVGWKGSYDPWTQGPAVSNEPEDYSVKENLDDQKQFGWTGMHSQFPSIWSSHFSTGKNDPAFYLNGVGTTESDDTIEAESIPEVNNLGVNVSKSEYADSSSRITLKGMEESRNIAPVESESSHTIRNLDVNVFKSEHAGNSDTMTGVGIGGESNQTNRNLYEWNSDLESAERTDNKMGAGTSNLTELNLDVDVSNSEHADSSDVMTGVGTGGKSTSTKENLDEQSLNLEPADSTDSKIGVGTAGSGKTVKYTSNLTELNLDVNVSKSKDEDCTRSCSIDVRPSKMITDSSSISMSGEETTESDPTVDKQTNLMPGNLDQNVFHSEDAESIKSCGNLLDPLQVTNDNTTYVETITDHTSTDMTGGKTTDSDQTVEKQTNLMTENLEPNVSSSEDADSTENCGRLVGLHQVTNDSTTCTETITDTKSMNMTGEKTTESDPTVDKLTNLMTENLEPSVSSSEDADSFKSCGSFVDSHQVTNDNTTSVETVIDTNSANMTDEKTSVSDLTVDKQTNLMPENLDPNVSSSEDADSFRSCGSFVDSHQVTNDNTTSVETITDANSTNMPGEKTTVSDQTVDKQTNLMTENLEPNVSSSEDADSTENCGRLVGLHQVINDSTTCTETITDTKSMNMTREKTTESDPTVDKLTNLMTENLEPSVSSSEDADSFKSCGNFVDSHQVTNDNTTSVETITDTNSTNMTGEKTTVNDQTVDKQTNLMTENLEPNVSSSEDADSTENCVSSEDSFTMTNDSTDYAEAITSLTERLGDLGIDARNQTQIESFNPVEDPFNVRNSNFEISSLQTINNTNKMDESELQAKYLESGTESSNDLSLTCGYSKDVASSQKQKNATKLSPAALEKIDQLIGVNMFEFSNSGKQESTSRKSLSIENDSNKRTVVFDVANASPSISETSDTSFNFEDDVPSRKRSDLVQEGNINGSQSIVDGLTKSHQLPECCKQEVPDYSTLQAANCSPTSEPDISDLYHSVSLSEIHTGQRLLENYCDRGSASVLDENVEVDASHTEVSGIQNTGAESSQRTGASGTLTDYIHSVEKKAPFTSVKSDDDDDDQMEELDVERRTSGKEKLLPVTKSDDKMTELNMERGDSVEENVSIWAKSEEEKLQLDMKSRESNKEKMLWNSLLSTGKAQNTSTKTPSKLVNTHAFAEGHLGASPSILSRDTKDVLAANSKTTSSQGMETGLSPPMGTVDPPAHMQSGQINDFQLINPRSHQVQTPTGMKTHAPGLGESSKDAQSAYQEEPHNLTSVASVQTTRLKNTPNHQQHKPIGLLPVTTDTTRVLQKAPKHAASGDSRTKHLPHIPVSKLDLQTKGSSSPLYKLDVDSKLPSDLNPEAARHFGEGCEKSDLFGGSTTQAADTTGMTQRMNSSPYSSFTGSSFVNDKLLQSNLVSPKPVTDLRNTESRAMTPTCTSGHNDFQENNSTDIDSTDKEFDDNPIEFDSSYKESDGNQTDSDSSSSYFEDESNWKDQSAYSDQLDSTTGLSAGVQQLVEGLNTESMPMDNKEGDVVSCVDQPMLEAAGGEIGDMVSANTSTAVTLTSENRIIPISMMMGDAKNSKMIFNMIVPEAANKTGHRSDNIIDQTVRELDFEKELFAKTSSYNVAEELLKDKGVIFLVGPPGSGKTLMARKLAKSVCRSDRDNVWIPLCLKSPREWREHVRPDSHQVILMEDIFGFNDFDKKAFSKWKILNMESMLDAKTKRIIFTLRMHVLREALPHLEKFPLFNWTRVVDIVQELDDGKLSVREKSAMLSKHIKHHNLNDKIGMDIVKAIISSDTLSNFPSCCKFFCQDRRLHTVDNAVHFFNNPVEYFEKEICLLYNEENKTKFGALLLTMVTSGMLDTRLLNDNKKSDLHDEMRRHLKAVGISTSVTFATIKCSATHLILTYLTRNSDHFVFTHPSIHDAVSMVYGKNHSEYLLQVCTVSFLHQYVIVSDHPLANRQKLTLKPNDPGLIQRFIKEIKDGRPVHVCKHQALSHKVFVCHFIKTCEEIRELNLLTSIPTDCHMPLLYWAIWSDRCIFFKAILEQYKKQKKKLEPNVIYQIANGCCICCNIEVMDLLHKCLKLDIFKIPSLAIPVPFENSLASKKLVADADITSDYVAHAGKLIHVACFHGNDEMVVFLLTTANSDASYINMQDEFGRTPCHIAAKCGHLKVFQTLMKNRCSLSIPSKTGNLPIHEACSGGHTDIVRMILDVHPHHLFEKGTDELTPLHVAVLRSNALLVEWLMDLEHGRRVTNLDHGHADREHGHMMTDREHGHMMADREHGHMMADREHGHMVTDPYRASSLIHLACTRPRNSQVLRMLCEKFQNGIDQEDYFLKASQQINTPLHVICDRSADVEMVETLIEFGVCVNKVNVKHQTALHLACRNTRCSICLVETLIKHKLNVFVKDFDGQTALDYASSNEDVKKILAKHYVSLIDYN